MAGNDNIIINQYERIISDDINGLESIGARNLAEAVRYSQSCFSPDGTTTGDALETSDTRAVVLGGLVVERSTLGASATVSAGLLSQYSTTLSPTPGTYDSPYRIGRLEDTFVIAKPTVGSDTWCLLQAQVIDEVTTIATRDVWNPATQTFAPQPVNKVDRRSVALAWKVGTSTTIPDVDVNYVPIFAALVSTSAISNTRCVDMRPLRQEPAFLQWYTGPTLLRRHIQSNSQLVNGPYPNGILNFMNPTVDAIVQGQRAWLRGRNDAFASSEECSILVDSSLVKDPAHDPTAADFSYVYLAPWGGGDMTVLPIGQPLEWSYLSSGVFTRDVQSAGLTRGILVWSAVAPQKQGDMASGGFLGLPAPFDVNPVFSGRAVCLYAVKRLGSNLYACPAALGDFSKEVYRANSSKLLFSTTFVSGTPSRTLNLAGLIPKTARAVRLQITLKQNGFNDGSETTYIAVKDPLGYGTILPVSRALVPIGAGGALSLGFVDVNVVAGNLTFTLDSDFHNVFDPWTLSIFVYIEGYYETVG